MRSVKGIIIGFLLILLGFAAAQYSLIAAGILSAGGLAAVVVSALPKRAEKQEPQAAPTFHMDEAVTNFYRFTRDSFSLEGYHPLPFDDEIPVAI